MKAECTHCFTVIPSEAPHRLVEWWTPQGAHCTGLRIDCPLCGEISTDSVRLVPESVEDADFLNPARAMALIAGALS